MWLSSHCMHVVFWYYCKTKRPSTSELLIYVQVLFFWGAFPSLKRVILSGTTPIGPCRVQNWSQLSSAEQFSLIIFVDRSGLDAINTNWKKLPCHFWDLFQKKNCNLNGQKTLLSILMIHRRHCPRMLFSTVQEFDQDYLQYLFMFIFFSGELLIHLSGCRNPDALHLFHEAFSVCFFCFRDVASEYQVYTKRKLRAHFTKVKLNFRCESCWKRSCKTQQGFYHRSNVYTYMHYVFIAWFALYQMRLTKVRTKAWFGIRESFTHLLRSWTPIKLACGHAAKLLKGYGPSEPQDSAIL